LGQDAIEPAGGVDSYYCEKLNAAAGIERIEPPVLGEAGKEAGPPGARG